ncbi:hypothetical protein GCM10012285_33360 [Streptomyces kronopolitis]|uniref:Uncharacterized protein n=1 Tax=Streptomyces kronopolitis TaxID=1612435 RepID=A0ABQ2JK18_9ACTN|nr:hypothetical protein GCM10012285_33360 [Streptomyces kronopolitis]
MTQQISETTQFHKAPPAEQADLCKKLLAAVHPDYRARYWSSNPAPSSAASPACGLLVRTECAAHTISGEWRRAAAQGEVHREGSNPDPRKREPTGPVR